MNIKDTSSEKYCPICKNETSKVNELDAKYIKNKLSEHFNNKIDKNIEIIDYSLLKCRNCNFEYAVPFIDGSSSFYNWVTSQPKYYPDTRWEYAKVLDLMKNKDNQLKLLDVGCGDGKFLDYIKENKVLNINSFGLDPTNESALKCSNKGHKVFCMDTKKFKANFQNELFDTITSFHVPAIVN